MAGSDRDQPQNYIQVNPYQKEEEKKEEEEVGVDEKKNVFVAINTPRVKLKLNMGPKGEVPLLITFVFLAIAIIYTFASFLAWLWEAITK